MIYLYVGPDSNYLKLQIRREFLQKKTALEKSEIISYSAYDDLVQDVVMELSSPSFSGEKKIVIYDKCYFLSSSKERVPGSAMQDLDALKEYIEHPDFTNDFYMLVNGSLAKNELVQLIKSKCRVLIFEKIEDDELKNIASEFFRLRNKRIDDLALLELVQRVKGDYSVLLNELAKLDSFPDDRISIGVVKSLVHKPLEDNIFNIANHLVQGESILALSLFRDLLMGGNDPHYLLSILASQFRFMAAVSYLVNNSVPEAEIAMELNAKPYRVRVTKRSIRDLKPQAFYQVLNMLYEIDYRNKVELDDLVRSLEVFIAEFKPRFLRK